MLLIMSCCYFCCQLESDMCAHVCICVFAECFLLFTSLCSALPHHSLMLLALPFSPIFFQPYNFCFASPSAPFSRAFSFPSSVLTHALYPLHAACNRGLLSDVFLSWEAGLCQSTARFTFNAAPLALPVKPIKKED